MLKKILKSALRGLAPAHFDALMAQRDNRIGQRVMERHGVPALTSQIVQKYGSHVRSGPFATMKLLEQSAGSAYLPKLIGSYEQELNPVWEAILQTEYQTVADVGCAEGFYAIGLAMRLPGQPTIHAFDINREAQRMCQNMAQMNGVSERVRVQGACDPARLEQMLRGRSLVVCDCEGYEAILLDPTRAPVLRQTEIVVELHDAQVPGTTALLQERFVNSHAITLLNSEPRRGQDYPDLAFLTPAQQDIAVSEFRGAAQQWAWMVPHSLF